jgi:hypothetical protein
MSADTGRRMPQRIQRRRIKGWRMPENTVYVGRPSIWGNPYREGQVHQIGGLAVTDDAVLAFRLLVTSEGNWPYREEAKRELGGKNLACWCPLTKPCHADVLLEIANPSWEPPQQGRRG